MKFLRNLFLALLCFVPATVMAQMLEPVKWSHTVTDNGEGYYTVQIKATIDEGWHIYDSRYLNPTTLEFFVGKDVELEGHLRTISAAKKLYDADLDITYGEYEKEAIFEQDFKAVEPNGTVGVAIGYMACKEGMCLAPTIYETSISLSEELGVSGGDTPTEGAETEQVVSTPTVVAKEAIVETPTKDTETPAEATETPAAPQVAPKAEATETPAETKENNTPEVKPSTSTNSSDLWSMILQAILWGFAALLTPCVFPMVPMTVSFFMKNSGSASRGRINASLYGAFIVALYTLPIAILIIIAHVAGGDAVTADIFNWIATHWFPNLIFFAVFMVFAASFFGAFEITLPSKLVNKSDAQSEKGGILGIFFMALTLVLVSFSCTGPIVGVVVVNATSGSSDIWSPILTMLAFSTAFALPFTLFAFFPSMLKKMPKSGGWLNSVKVVLGFVEVALGFKFLSTADQTYGWGLLDREIYLAIWIVVFTLLGLYLLGKLRFAHDSEVKHISVGRLGLAIAVFTFVVYMIPGMWGAPLKGLSGYLPPMHTHDFQVTVKKANKIRNAKYGKILHLPHNLAGYFELEQAKKMAERVGKPLFIDFTGHGCVNCREMEARVWSDPDVLEILQEEYVVVALYTDDKRQALEEDWVTTKSGKVLKTIGEINSYYQRELFKANAQPYYVIQGQDGKLLCKPRGYDLDVDAFIEYLEQGVDAYAKQTKELEKKNN